MSSAPDVLDQADALLLDFDGPLALLMPPPVNAGAAATARAALVGLQLPIIIADTTDHLEVLRYAVERYPERLAEVEEACTRIEIEAARSCRPSPQAAPLLAFASRRHLPVAVVSNNSAEAVRAFLDRYGWTEQVQAYSCRTTQTAHQMKPSPYLVESALRTLRVDPRRAVFVGDSVSDVLAGNAAGVPVVALAKHQQRRYELEAAGAAAVVSLEDVIGLTGQGP